MAGLRQQVQAIIETCKTVLATVAKKPETGFLDLTTLAVAQVIIEQAKAELPNDKVLAAVELKAPITWTAVLAAMETIKGSLPTENEAGLVERLQAARERTASK